MHELAVTESMLNLVLEEAAKAGAQRVDRINLVIGEMSGIVGESVEFYFGFLAKETVAESARLDFEYHPSQAMCRDCKRELALPELDWTCPECGSANLQIVGGSELYIDSIEVE